MCSRPARVPRLLLAAALLAAAPAWAQTRVYRSVDADGLAHFSDQAPAADAETVLTLASPPRARREAAAVRGTAGAARPAEFVPASPASLASLAPPRANPAEARRRDPATARIIQWAARTYGVEEALVRAVVDVESRFNPHAQSPAGAVGLMQLMPQTARLYAVQNAADPLQNVDGGTRYLHDLLRRYQGNTTLALAAYNAGVGAVRKAGNRVPPYAETQAYVPQVLARYDAARRAR